MWYMPNLLAGLALSVCLSLGGLSEEKLFIHTCYMQIYMHSAGGLLSMHTYLKLMQSNQTVPQLMLSS